MNLEAKSPEKLFPGLLWQSWKEPDFCIFKLNEQNLPKFRRSNFDIKMAQINALNVN